MHLIRRIHLRGILLTLSLLAFIVAAAAFAYSLSQTQRLAAQNRAIIAVQRADARRHCIEDAAVANRQRALDLTLMAADRQILAHLRDMPLTGTADHRLHQDLIGYYTTALTARQADLPVYINPHSC